MNEQQTAHYRALLQQAQDLMLAQQFDDAEKYAREVVAAAPQDGPAQNVMGEVFRLQKKFDLALQHYALAAKALPHEIAVMNNTGLAYQEMGNLNAALDCFQRAVQVDANNELVWNNLGSVLHRLGKPHDAISAYTRSLTLRPNYADALSNMSFVLQQIGRVDESARCADKAIALNPGHIYAQWHRALALLLLGDLKNGFAAYELRKNHPQFAAHFAHRHYSQPEWDGTFRPGLRLYVWTEQGLGDSIQLFRYVRLLADNRVTVSLECQPELWELFSGFDNISLLASGDRVPEFDAHVPLMSLPFKFGTELHTVPAKVPYLNVPRAKNIALRCRATAPFRIGIVWGGNPHHGMDMHRSVALEHFFGLSQLPGVTLYSLQKGSKRAEIENFRGVVVDLNDQLNSFSDTAFVLSQMHLTITVDTSVAHLAGALGQSVWLLVSQAVDWRWLTAGSTSPWYPSMKIFRQKEVGQWAATLSEVEQHLKRIL